MNKYGLQCQARKSDVKTHRVRRQTASELQDVAEGEVTLEEEPLGWRLNEARDQDVSTHRGAHSGCRDEQMSKPKMKTVRRATQSVSKAGKKDSSRGGDQRGSQPWEELQTVF